MLCPLNPTLSPPGGGEGEGKAFLASDPNLSLRSSELDLWTSRLGGAPEFPLLGGLLLFRAGELQQVRVDLVLDRRGHPVGRALVDLEGRVGNQLHRTHR